MEGGGVGWEDGDVGGVRGLGGRLLCKPSSCRGGGVAVLSCRGRVRSWARAGDAGRISETNVKSGLRHRGSMGQEHYLRGVLGYN
ncbi:hypothetical protein Tco_0273332 [Tanacetum coccineum]